MINLTVATCAVEVATHVHITVHDVIAHVVTILNIEQGSSLIIADDSKADTKVDTFASSYYCNVRSIVSCVT